MMRVYFAGANQHHWLEAMKGRYVLESFADIRPLTDRYRPTWAGGMLDSGAFSEMTTGRVIDLGAYIEFCQQHGAFYDAIVNLDDIKGDVDKSLRNLRAMEDAGLSPLPVFHQGEPLSVLTDLCASYGYIGLGFQRPIQNAKQWLDRCWNVIGDTTRVHGFGMTSRMGGWPFYSVDSKTWMLEVQGMRTARLKNANPMQYLTLRELLDIVLLSYDRRPKAENWAGSQQEMLFQASDIEAAT